MDDQSGSTRKPLFCPHCGHPINADEKFCGNCGFDLATYFATHGTPAGGSSSNAGPSDERPKPANNGANADTSKRTGAQKSVTEQMGDNRQLHSDRNHHNPLLDKLRPPCDAKTGNQWHGGKLLLSWSLWSCLLAGISLAIITIQRLRLWIAL